LQPRDRTWDGRWLLVSYSYPSEQRAERDRVRSLLSLQGFAALGRGLYIHPRDLTKPLMQALTDLQMEQRVHLFRADRTGPMRDPAFVAQLWDLDQINQRYGRILAEFSALRRRRSLYRSPRAAFRTRLALSIAYLAVAWGDPDLPDSLLPSSWKGHQIQKLVQQMYTDLVPRTLQYMESVQRQCEE
jgi:phenylacetic acid degradation operon negative regulatory protein